MAGLCDAARCPQATFHAEHREVWAGCATSTATFLGNPRLPAAEATRLGAEHARAQRVVDVKTLAREAGVSRASLYRTYQHLRKEFEQRLARMRDVGEIPDPRTAQIVRLTDENARLRQGLAERDQRIAELIALKTTAISRLIAQYTEIAGLRAALTDASNVRTLNRARLTPTAQPTDPDRTAS